MNVHRPRLLIIGNGMVATRAIDTLTRSAASAFDIQVFSAEPGAGYNRILLSSWLAGDTDEQEIITHPLRWYAERNVQLYAGVRVLAIDRARREVLTDDSRRFAYDHLLLATGSRSTVPDVPGVALPGVLSFRTRADVAQLLKAACTPTVIVGGGVLGLEAAYGLVRRGNPVTVVHSRSYVMDRQLDAESARWVQSQLEPLGIRFLFDARCTGFAGTDHLAAVQLADGRSVPAQRAVLAMGITPSTELARLAGLRCEQAIIVDDQMRTSDPNISALGECAEHRNKCHGLLAPLWEQVSVWVQTMLGDSHRRCVDPVVHTRLKIPSVPVFVAGEFVAGEFVAGEFVETEPMKPAAAENPAGQGGERSGPSQCSVLRAENLYYRDPSHNAYRHLQLRGDHLTGVRLCGDISDAAWYLEQLQARKPVTGPRANLLFGRHAA